VSNIEPLAHLRSKVAFSAGGVPEAAFPWSTPST
jgi:hypothetical protein